MKELIKEIKKARFVHLVGNGGSASTANHFAQDLVKMCGIRAISLCSNEALVTAYANDNGYDNVFIDQLQVFLDKDDLLITISGSGESLNILRAIDYAKKLGASIYSFPTMKEKKCNMQEVENIHLQLAHSICKELL